MIGTAYKNTNYKCYECKGVHSSRQGLQKALCKDSKRHFICRNCAEKRIDKSHEQQNTQEIIVTQCACGNIAASSTMVNGLCLPCQRAQEATKNIVPFQVEDVVKFIPHLAQEFVSKGKHYALALNCHNYGSEEAPNWAVDVQFLKEIDGVLRLTPVKAYMIASWQIEKSNRQWDR